MLKFSQINEKKSFFPDPSIIKKYASFIIPLYLQGELECEDKLIDEWLDISRSKVRDRNKNIICDLEIKALKNIFDDPLSENGYNKIRLDIEKKCAKLEIFLRKYYQDKFDFR
jgi:hypothetical protein